MERMKERERERRKSSLRFKTMAEIIRTL
jgi:hypothetical protein